MFKEDGFGFICDTVSEIHKQVYWLILNKQESLKSLSTPALWTLLTDNKTSHIISFLWSDSSTQLLERGSSSFLSLPLFPHFLPALPSSAHGSLLALRAVASLSLYEAASQMAQVACPQKDAHRLQISSASDPCPIPTQSNKTSANYCFKQHILNYASNSFRSWEARMYQYNQDRGETTSLDIGHQESHSTQLMMDFNK